MSEHSRRKDSSLRYIQYGALPYRTKGNSKFEIMLVTSRNTGRWIIPKGWPERGIAAHHVAANEALEEAGVLGKVSSRPVGSFSYEKTMKDGAVAGCRVKVFALRVTRQRAQWPEKRARKIEWYTPSKAARVVQEPELQRIIRKFAKR